MAVNQRKDGRWQVTWRDETGKLRSAYFHDEETARSEDARIKWLKQSKQELPQAIREQMFLDELTQLWIDNKKVQGRKTRWLKEWAATFNQKISPHLCNVPVNHLTQADVLAVVARYWASSAQATRNRYIGYLKATCAYGLEQGLIKHNPLAGWKAGKELRRKSPLTLNLLQRLQSALADSPRSKHLAWAIDVAWHIPVRPGRDLYSLTFDQVRYDRSGIEVYHSKVDKYAFVSIKPDFLDRVRLQRPRHKTPYLIEYRGRPVKRMDTALKNWCDHLSMPRICMYDVRHLWITTALDKGLEVSAIAYLAGTSAEMILANYYEPHAAERQRAVAIMPDLETKPRVPAKVLKISNSK